MLHPYLPYVGGVKSFFYSDPTTVDVQASSAVPSNIGNDSSIDRFTAHGDMEDCGQDQNSTMPLGLPETLLA